MRLSKQQRIQEEEYAFPYHYLDLHLGIYRDAHFIEYLSKLSLIIEEMKPFKGQTVLDIGCGDGRLCYELKKQKVRIIGVDFSQRALAFARAFNPDVLFFNQDISSLDLKAPVDMAVMADVLEHIRPEDIPIVLKKVSSVLKKGGKLIVTVPTTNIRLHPKHYQHFTKQSLEKALKKDFAAEKILGIDKQGLAKEIFNFQRRTLILAYMFKRLVPLNFFAAHIRKSYKPLSVCSPDDGAGMIGVFVNKP